MQQKGYGRKYLVDQDGQVCYLVDPTITGTLTQRDEVIRVGPELEVKLGDAANRITDTLAQRDPETGKLVYFKIWKHIKPKDAEDAQKQETKGIPFSKYPDLPGRRIPGG